jgi:GR25 family glycosyltransferase involved in LPS biosynthesis
MIKPVSKLRSRFSIFRRSIRFSFHKLKLKSLVLNQGVHETKDLELNLDFIDDIQIFYINLDKRRDRNMSILSEFNRMNLKNFKKISGVPLDNGALGCALAHISAINSWMLSESKLLWICEDDIQFYGSKEKISELIKEFVNTPYLSVLCLGNLAKGKTIKISSNLRVALNVQTTSSYLVKPAAVPIILESFIKSKNLLEEGQPSNTAAIDVLWKKIQFKNYFAIPSDLVVSQRPSFSDIQKRFTDYKN